MEYMLWDNVPENTYVYSFNPTIGWGTKGAGLEYPSGNNPTFDESNTYILVHNQTTFDHWTLLEDFEYNSFGQQYYNYDQFFYTDQFFPVDGLGFGDDGLDHNYKWCIRIDLKTEFQDPIVPFQVEVSHSDDLFFFVNGVLYYSLLGATDISRFSLDYNLFYQPKMPVLTQIFNCNRKYRAGYHHFGLVSDYPLDCHFFDQCGVCNGDGSSCLCTTNYCYSDEYLCIKRECIDPITCFDSAFNCTEVYPGDLCISQSCQLYAGCASTAISCDDSNPCTIDSCDPAIGCINDLIPNCIPCDNSPCLTTDLCEPQECDPLLMGICVSKPLNCTHINPCILGECDSSTGQCIYVEIVGCGGSSSSIEDSSQESTTTASTVGSTTSSTVSSTSSTSTTIFFTTTDFLGSTISHVTTGLPTSTSGTTGLPTTTSVSTTSETGGGTTSPTLTASTISSTVSSTTSVTITTTFSSTTASLGSTISSTTETVSSTGGVSTASSTLSSTSGVTTSLPHDPCANRKCGKGERCYNVKERAICVKTNCLSCEDLNCQSQGLKCISFKLDKLPNDLCNDCCEYSATCSN
ncbi:hypothetical protein RB653_006943 [Dictyostelium firmibasis]|uniref:PA14 domain-containing protein n=1 Tax=Dictyostelium firmibasis TaxID=79012 RepID=A0AAN7YLM5_9MYCE